MDARTLLAQVLESGRELATETAERAERRLEIPDEGAERDIMLRGVKKGAVLGGMLALLVGTRFGRRLGRTAVRLGTVAAVGGLAYRAYKNWLAGEPNATLDAAPVDQLEGREAEARSLALLRAIISAAKADGHIDVEERADIAAQMKKLELDPAIRAELDAELARPSDVQAVAALAEGSRAVGAEIYAASLTVIDPANPKERAYLEELATALDLPRALIQELEAPNTQPA